MAVFKSFVLLAVIQVACSKPLLFKEVKLKRNLEFAMKPIEFKPITFIKEKFGAFGHFGTKHTIAKRSPFAVPPKVPEPPPPFMKIKLEKSFEAIPPEHLIPPPIEFNKEEEHEKEVKGGLHKCVPNFGDDIHPPPIVPPESEHEAIHLPELVKCVEIHKVVPPVGGGIHLPPIVPFEPESKGIHTAKLEKRLIIQKGIPPIEDVIHPPVSGSGHLHTVVDIPPVPSTLHPPPNDDGGDFESLLKESDRIKENNVVPFTPHPAIDPRSSQVIVGPEHHLPKPLNPPQEFVAALPVGIPGPPPGKVGGSLLGLVPPPPAGIKEGPLPKSNLLTDIARVDEINSYLKAVEAQSPVKKYLEENLLVAVPGNSIENEVKKDTAVDKPDSALSKGSRLALYFGNILLQVMSQVINSARSAIGQYSQPAPA